MRLNFKSERKITETQNVLLCLFSFVSYKKLFSDTSEMD
jgi:hypothetical protein